MDNVLVNGRRHGKSNGSDVYVNVTLVKASPIADT